MRTAHVTPSPRRILVVANETATADVLYTTVASYVDGLGPTEILVVAPALNSRLRPFQRQWLSDDDARKAAVRRVRACVARLSRAGVDAEGMVGDADPLQAIEDALRIFPADRLIVSTHPEGRSNWLARGLVDRAELRFALPVTHIVVVPDGREAIARRPSDAYLAA